MQRGLPTNLALICAPTDDDYRKFVLKEVDDPIMEPDPVLSVKEPKKKFAAQKVRTKSGNGRSGPYIIIRLTCEVLFEAPRVNVALNAEAKMCHARA